MFLVLGKSSAISVAVNFYKFNVENSKQRHGTTDISAVSKTNIPLRKPFIQFK